MTQPYSIVSSSSALSIRVLSWWEALGRSCSRGCTSGSCTVRCLCMRRSTSMDRSASLWLVPPEVYELVRLVVQLSSCLYAEYGGGLRHPFVRKHSTVLSSDTVRPNDTHTITISPIISLGCSGDCETVPALSA